jgi:NAD(P)-dependent dehydrogenase (short-subunit alcohol dehydrogenase family)
MQLSKKIRVYDRATAIVTGGASGIGRGLAEELAKSGCYVVLADRQVQLAEEVASRICASGGKAMAYEVDVTDYSAVQQLIRETVELTGRLDYMFNNAGIAIGGNVNHYGIEDWNQIIDVNLRGVINGVQAAYKVMITQGFGHIVNTASLAGIMPSPGSVAYASTKHAVVGLSNSLRAEGARFGVRVSVLCPGFVRTAIFDGGGKYGKMLIDLSPEQHRHLFEYIEKFRPMEPNVFARKALNSVARNKAIIVLPMWWKMFWWIHRLFPALGIILVQRPFQDFQEKLGIV